MNAFWENALERGDAEAVRELLEHGENVDARDAHGQTGLMRAAHAGDGDVVEALLEHAAQLDETAKYGLSALMLAIVAGHVQIAQMLMREGADVSLRGSGAPGFAGKNAYDLAVDKGLDELAAELGQLPSMKG